MKNLILLVDDDKLPMKFYVKALAQSGFKVKHYSEPDGALAFVEEKGSQIKAAILDVMMPPGEAYEGEDTKEGLRTGVFLWRDVKRLCRQDMPIVILTNVKNPETLAMFEEGPLPKVVQKMGCPPFELAKMVSDMISENENRSDS